MSFTIKVENKCVSQREITVKHYKPYQPTPSPQTIPKPDGKELVLTSLEDYLEIQIEEASLNIKTGHTITLPEDAFINFLPHTTDSDIYLNVTEASEGRNVLTIPTAGANEEHNWKLLVKMPPSSFNIITGNDNVTISDDGG